MLPVPYFDPFLVANSHMIALLHLKQFAHAEICELSFSFCAIRKHTS
jgi:hypothetical protein